MLVSDFVKVPRDASVARIKCCNHSPLEAALCQARPPPDENSRMSRRIIL